MDEYKDKYSEEVLKQMALLTATDMCGGNCTQYVLVGGNGNCTSALQGNVCSNSLRSGHGLRRPQFVVVKLITAYAGSKCLELEPTIPYLDWLFKHSPLADFYVTDSAEEFIAVGSAVVRCDIPANLMLIANVAIRYTWEFPDMIESWYALVKLGVRESDALVLCQMIRNTGGSVSFGGAIGNNNHFIFPSDPSINVLSNFSNGEWPVVEELFSEVGCYKGMQYTWGDMGDLKKSISINILVVKRETKGVFGGSVKEMDNAYEQIANALSIVLEKEQEKEYAKD